jgi:sigma-B regulation protein RsbU (phosphoserine phosphatase)
VIQPLLSAVSEDQITLRLRGDLPLVILGSISAAVGLAAIVVTAFRWRSRERVLLWFGLFAGPYGARLLTSSFAFQLAFGQPQRFWLFIWRLIDFATIVPALLLFEDFYGKGWRSSVRWLIRGYVVFATVAFTSIVVQNNPDLVPAAGIGTVFLLPLILLLGRFAGYQRPRTEGQGVLSWGLLALFVTFAHDRIANASLLNWHVQTEPYGLFVLICCLGYVAARRVLANEKQLVSLSEEMRAATQIQASILPRTAPKFETFDIAVRYAPMSAVAGDFYDFLQLRPGCLGIVVADVAGHGVPAALVAAMVKVAVSSQINDGADPGKVIAGLNSVLCREAEGQYATAVYLFLDEEKLAGRYSAAGHPPLLLWRHATRTLSELNAGGLLLGVRRNEAYPQSEFSFEAGDRLLLYTDGLVEATNPNGKEFGEARLSDFIDAHESLPAEQLAERLLQEVLAWPGNGNQRPQADDITVVVIDIGSRH